MVPEVELEFKLRSAGTWASPFLLHIVGSNVPRTWGKAEGTFRVLLELRHRHPRNSSDVTSTWKFTIQHPSLQTYNLYNVCDSLFS